MSCAIEVSLRSREKRWFDHLGKAVSSREVFKAEIGSQTTLSYVT